MKRALIALLILVASALIAHEVYCYFRPVVGETRCTMTWLRTQLDLTPDQFERISAIHNKHWQEVRQMECTKSCGTECATKCEQSAKRLIDEVCAVLTPAQREKYARLVSPCSGEGRRKSSGH